MDLVVSSEHPSLGVGVGMIEPKPFLAVFPRPLAGRILHKLIPTSTSSPYNLMCLSRLCMSLLFLVVGREGGVGLGRKC